MYGGVCECWHQLLHPHASRVTAECATERVKTLAQHCDSNRQLKEKSINGGVKNLVESNPLRESRNKCMGVMALDRSPTRRSAAVSSRTAG